MSTKKIENIKGRLRSIAFECVKKGPGYAQEGVVLYEAQKELQPKSLQDEQDILEAWQQLFAERELAWGYNLDNPSAPFFHAMANHTVVAAGAN